MQFKIKRSTIVVDYLFFFMLSFLLLFNSKATLVVLLLSILHELGHIAALICCGGEIKLLKLSSFGMVMVPYDNNLSLVQEIVFVLAGPAVNLAITLATLPFDNESVAQISALSFLLGAFNLIPVSSLDGGKALSNFLLLYFNEETVVKIMRGVTVVLLIVLAFVGLIMLKINHHNYSVLLIVVYLTILFINKPMN